MKEPKIIKEEMVKCVSCGKLIHIDEFGGVSKEGMFHNNICCFPETKLKTLQSD